MSGGFRKVAIASAAMLATVTQTVAGGYAASCYERTHSPAVYRTVHEKVMVDPGSSYVEVIPAVYGTQKRQVELRPAREKWHVVPARYGYQNEKVMIEPARTVARVIPARTKTVYKKVMVSQGGYTWEWQIIKGKKVLCKVKRPPVYETVAHTVVVSPERVVHETVPARWGYEKRKVLIEHERKERYVVPAEYGYVQEKVLIRAAEKRVHRTPPRYETVSRQVKVQEASSGWRPVSRYCKG